MDLNVVIIEDAHENIETLKYLLDQCANDVEVIETADNLSDAKRILIKGGFDIAFLDIQLKEGVIFEILDEIVNGKPLTYDIVFVTAYNKFEYATKAIQFACLDYITKPINQEKLEEVIEKSLKKKQTYSTENQVKFLIELLKSNMNAPESISITLSKGIIEVIQFKDLLYIEADANTCIFYLSNGDNKHSTKSFAHYLELMEGSDEFVQISRNCMANIQQVKSYDHRNKTLILRNGAHLVVSHRFSKAFKQELLSTNGSSGLLSNLLGLFKS